MERRTIRITIPPPVSQSGKKKNPKDLKEAQDPSTGADMEALQLLLEKISSDMTEMSTKISTLGTDIGSLRTEVTNDIATLRTEVTTFKTELKQDIDKQNQRIEAVEQRVAEMEERETILIKVVKRYPLSRPNR